MDFRHLIVTCLFSKLRLPFDNQKVKENYTIFHYMLSSLLANFVARPMCRSDRSPASVYDVTGSTFMSVA